MVTATNRAMRAFFTRITSPLGFSLPAKPVAV